MMQNVDIESLIRDQICFDHPNTPFVDAFAHFNVRFDEEGSLGFSGLGLRGTPFLYHLLEPCGMVWIRWQGEDWKNIPRDVLTCLPWLATEGAHVDLPNGTLRIRTQQVFENENTLHAAWECEVDGTLPEGFSLAVSGLLKPDQEIPYPYRASYPELNYNALISELTREGNAVRGRLFNRAPPRHLPEAAFCFQAHEPCWSLRLATPSAALQESSTDCKRQGQGRPLYFSLLSDESFPLFHEKSCQLKFTWQVRMRSDGEAIDPPVPLSAPLNMEERIHIRKRSFLEQVRADALPAASPNASLQRLLRARTALLRCGLRGKDGEFGEHTACLCTSDSQFFSTLFFWDSLFSAAALADFNLPYAEGAVQATFTRQDARNGATQENQWNHTLPQRSIRCFPQAPVATWAVAHALHNGANDAFLATIYPHLTENHRYWEEYADVDRDGLSEWLWTGQTADNSPLYDPYANDGTLTGCMWIPPIASVQLNSFLYADAKRLQEFALRLGKTEDAERYAARQNRLAAALHEVCFVEAEKRYWDYNHANHTHRRVKTFYMFWPVVCGVPMDPAVKKELIEEVLLDPEQFFGEVPFPSVAYDEPRYDPRGYWRGKSWPHISYWIIEALWREGYPREADLAADRLLKWAEAHYGFRENFETDVSLPDATGHVDYNWGISCYYLLGIRRYRDFSSF